jgi:hypothetical protein
VQTGTRAVLEITAYPGGHVHVVGATVDGPPRSRRITQGPFLMFRDGDEAKDAIDEIIDRLVKATD